MIQVLDKAMRIMELLGKNPKKSYPLSEIAQTLSLDKGTCTRILKSLSGRGFVQQETPRGGYQLGYKLYHILGNHVDNVALTKIARKDIEILGKELNETAMLVALINDKRVVLYSTIPDRDVFIHTDRERSCYSMCASRVIMAFYTPSHLENCIIRLGLPDRNEWPEIYESQSPEREMMNVFASIRQNGYYMLDDRHGIVGFSAPLFQNGHVVGSVGTYVPKERLNDTKTVLNAVLHCAKEINLKLKKAEMI